MLQDQTIFIQRGVQSSQRRDRIEIPGKSDMLVPAIIVWASLIDATSVRTRRTYAGSGVTGPWRKIRQTAQSSLLFLEVTRL